jgi:hypothetical protein
MFTRILSLCFILFVVPTLAWAESYFEIIDNDENRIFGTITELNQKQIVIDVGGEGKQPQTLPLDKVVKIRNLAPSPYDGIPAATVNPLAPTQPTPVLPQEIFIKGGGRWMIEEIEIEDDVFFDEDDFEWWDEGWGGGQLIIGERHIPGGKIVQPVPSAGRNAAQRRMLDDFERVLKANEQNIRKTFPASVIAIELKDGSRLTATSFAVAKNQGVCRLLDQETDVTIPLANISSVRFTVRSLLEVNNPHADWQRLAIPKSKGDQLIVGNPGAFDVYTGILSEITDETVSFAVDDEVLPVPRRKVFGVVFHGENAPAAKVQPLATVSLWSGTRGVVSDLRLLSSERDVEGKDKSLMWTTTTGVTVTIPLAMVSEIDFGEKGVAYLFDFERARQEFSPSLSPNVKPEQLKLLQTFYESRSKTSREIMMDGVAYKRGVTLQGKVSLEYRLPKQYALLKMVIGVEDQYRPNALSSLRILADTQVLGAWELRGDSAAQVIRLHLPPNCRVLTIIAEPLPQSNVPVVLTIADPTLVE